MAWYDQAPAWTAPIAGLTAWFVWPALSAIFSALALSATIFLATQSNRDRRRREAAIVKAIIYPIGTATNTLHGELKKLTNNEREFRTFLSDARRKAYYQSLLDHLADIKVVDIPATGAIDCWSTGMDHIRDCIDEAEEWAKLPVAELREQLTGTRDGLRELSLDLVKIARSLGGAVEKHEDIVVKAYFEHAPRPIARALRALIPWLREFWRTRPWAQGRQPG